MVMCTPRCILCLAKLISKQAILAPVTRVFMATDQQVISQLTL